MAAARVIAWIFIGCIGFLAGYLWFLNRGSEKIAANLPVALAVGSIGVLLTLLFSLQPEEKTMSFPIEYVVDQQTLRPLVCDALPDSTIYSDAGGMTTFPAWRILVDVEKDTSIATGETDDTDLQKLYRGILLRQMLDVLRFTYLKSWDAQPSHIDLPTGGSQTLCAPKEVRPGTRLTNDDLMAAFHGDTTGAGSAPLEFLNLPPDTVLSGEIGPDTTSLKLKNTFVAVDIVIADRGVAAEMGDLRSLCRMTFEESTKYKRPRYLVTFAAKFNQVRTGHVSMPVYRHWADVMFSELQRFDSEYRWRILKDKYLLLYANRTKTPIQELVDETAERAKRPR
jgi:hypothetical protein